MKTVLANIIMLPFLLFWVIFAAMFLVFLGWIALPMACLLSAAQFLMEGRFYNPLSFVFGIALIPISMHAELMGWDAFVAWHDGLLFGEGGRK